MMILYKRARFHSASGQALVSPRYIPILNTPLFRQSFTGMVAENLIDGTVTIALNTTTMRPTEIEIHSAGC